MKFTLSTKPLADALNLGVIPGNISKFYQVSCLAQVTATKRELIINLEANNVYTELRLKGTGDEEGPVTAFIDCLIFKQIVSTLDASVTDIEYTEGAIILHSGSSKITLPFLADAADGELKKPSPADPNAPTVPVDLDDWKFIKDYQMYAIALSFVHPVYTNAWVSEEGDVIVGDFDNSLFTFSKKSKLGKTCLLPDTIVNLFNSLPKGAIITLMDTSYRVDVKTDGYEYASQFLPRYEGEDGNGSYSADIIMGAVTKSETNAFKVAVAPIIKFLNQSDLLSASVSAITVNLEGDVLHLFDENIDCKIKVEGECKPFTALFKSDQFKAIVGHADAENITISPLEQDDIVSGLAIWTKDLTVMIGSIQSGEE